MIKADELIPIVWNSRNVKYYMAKGYLYTHIGDEFFVRVEDLQPSSRVKVKVICDYCGDEFEMYMYAYTKSTQNSTTVACGKCKTIKTRQTMVERYGVDNCMLVNEFKDKMLSTIQNRYGVSSPVFLPQHQEAMKHYDKQSAKEKYVATCLARYGVDNTAKLEEAKVKAKATCIERYGGESSQCDPRVHGKTINTMLNGGSIPTSKAERALVERLQAIYGPDNCCAQYNFDKCAFDCLLTVADVKIDVEYDGEYWHRNRTESDKRRDYYVMNRGIKVLRFKGEQEVPSPNLIQNSVSYLVNSEHKHLIVNIKDEDIV